jgi:hypothetical protein
MDGADDFSESSSRNIPAYEKETKASTESESDYQTVNEITSGYPSETETSSAPTETFFEENESEEFTDAAPDESLKAEYFDMREGFWVIPTAEQLKDTTWYAETYTDSGYMYWYELSFLDSECNLRWDNDREIHEYSGAPWSISYNNDVAVIEIDLGNFEGVKRFSVLITTEKNLLYTCADIMNGEITLEEPDVSSRTLERIYG